MLLLLKNMRKRQAFVYRNILLHSYYWLLSSVSLRSQTAICYLCYRPGMFYAHSAYRLTLKADCSWFAAADRAARQTASWLSHCFINTCC
jgi:hypothetical protein